MRREEKRIVVSHQLERRDLKRERGTERGRRERERRERRSEGEGKRSTSFRWSERWKKTLEALKGESIERQKDRRREKRP